MLLSGHHFIHYARSLVIQLESELERLSPDAKELMQRVEGETAAIGSLAEPVGSKP
jgi:hypothetical protein